MQVGSSTPRRSSSASSPTGDRADARQPLGTGGSSLQPRAQGCSSSVSPSAGRAKGSGRCERRSRSPPGRPPCSCGEGCGFKALAPRTGDVTKFCVVSRRARHEPLAALQTTWSSRPDGRMLATWRFPAAPNASSSPATRSGDTGSRRLCEGGMGLVFRARRAEDGRGGRAEGAEARSRRRRPRLPAPVPSGGACRRRGARPAPSRSSRRPRRTGATTWPSTTSPAARSATESRAGHTGDRGVRARRSPRSRLGSTRSTAPGSCTGTSSPTTSSSRATAPRCRPTSGSPKAPPTPCSRGRAR